MNTIFTNRISTAARLLRGLLLLSIMMLNIGGNARAQNDSGGGEAGITTAEALKSALEAKDETLINVTGSIKLELTEILQLGASKTLTISKGKTVTITGDSYINFNKKTLTINGGGTFECDQDKDYSITLDGEVLTLENITVNVKKGRIRIGNLYVDTGATINLDASGASKPLEIDYSLKVKDGGTININSFTDVGIEIKPGDLSIENGGIVKVGIGSGKNQGIYISNYGRIVLASGGTLNAEKGSTIFLAEGSKVTGMSGKFSDQGKDLTENGDVTVGAEAATASTTGLTQGYYVWGNSKFAKADLLSGWELKEGTLTIKDDAGMLNWGRFLSDHSERSSTVTSAAISDGVTKIVDRAFSGCTELQSVTIPSSVTSIGSLAFFNAIALTSITIPSSVTSIGSSAFFNATALTSITIPASVETIGEQAFIYSGVQTFTVGGGNSFKTDDNGYALLTYDGKELVAFAPSTTGAYTIPDGVTTLREYSFNYSLLTSVVIPSTVTTIGEFTFGTSSALTSVTFKGDIPPTIGADAFYSCLSLSKIIVPKGSLDAYKTAVGEGLADKVVESGKSITVDNGALSGAVASEVTVKRDVIFENVKTEATKVGNGETSTLTLTGNNELGAITVGTGGSLTLDIEAGATVTVTSVTNAGTFTDNTGNVETVTGDASLDLTGTGAMPSDQTAEEQVTLTVNPTIANDADVTYQWQKQDNGSWTNVSNPYTRAATTTGNPSFKTNITGTYRCQIKVEKNSVSTTLLTTPATATVQPKSDPGSSEPPYVPPVYYTVTLPAVEGAVTDPVAGDYEVESWSTFRFYLTLDEDYNQSQPVVTTSRGDVISPRSSDGAYLVKYVRTDVAITISGVVKNPDPVANAELHTGSTITARDGLLLITTDRPSEAQVIALTGQLIRSLALPSGTTRIDGLADGIYIVRLNDGTVQKVIVRK